MAAPVEVCTNYKQCSIFNSWSEEVKKGELMIGCAVWAELCTTVKEYVS
jgi:hypothetical protein